ncbi:hypothetical protein SAMN02745165_01356 [Malonomonas rubra DSM 5091]|uniref:Uncharacterized protein n=1 Tax=Malonomonas rubra DSM 5091 TaxID=1122189 RepID=A0A1M6FNS0_MALRU|nr:hypothetical protein [Malonomonas rubra]SHI99361.1 hypothetical protein SAMN02745165_01356 [Malonomonas rubra DSM 5091]
MGNLQKISIDVTCIIHENINARKSFPECHDFIFDTFDEFARKIGTLFDPAELRLERSRLSANELPETRMRLALLNRRSHQDKGQAILSHLVHMFSSIALSPTKDAHISSEDLMTLTALRGRQLSRREEEKLNDLWNSVSKKVRISSIVVSLFSAETDGEPIKQEDSEALPVKRSKPSPEEAPQMGSPTNKKFTHTYQSSNYKIHLLDFQGGEGRNGVVIVRGKRFNVHFPPNIRNTAKETIEDHLGNPLYVEEIRYEDKTYHEIIAPDEFIEKDQFLASRKIQYRLTTYTPKQLNFSASVPHVEISSKTVVFRVLLPASVVNQIMNEARRSLGTKITLKESGTTVSGKRCHELAT